MSSAGRGQGVGPAAGHAAVEPGPVAEEVDGPDGEADGDPGRRDAAALQGAQASHGQPEEGRMRVAVGGQTGQAFGHPGAAPQPLEVLADGDERVNDVELVDADELAPTGVEEHAARRA